MKNDVERELKTNGKRYQRIGAIQKQDGGDNPDSSVPASRISKPSRNISAIALPEPEKMIGSATTESVRQAALSTCKAQEFRSWHNIRHIASKLRRTPRSLLNGRGAYHDQQASAD